MLQDDQTNWTRRTKNNSDGVCLTAARLRLDIQTMTDPLNFPLSQSSAKPHVSPRVLVTTLTMVIMIVLMVAITVVMLVMKMMVIIADDVDDEDDCFIYFRIMMMKMIWRTFGGEQSPHTSLAVF